MSEIDVGNSTKNWMKVGAQVIREERFANGRDVRNFFEKSLEKQALRISGTEDKDELSHLEPEDIVSAITELRESA